VQPSPGVWDFSRADEVLHIAEQRDMKVHGHTLVWGLPLTAANPFGGWTPTPGWAHGGDLSRDTAIRVMTGHIETVMTRYRGRIREWVVVNEALGETAVDGMKLSPNIWLDRIGPDYVAPAFAHARKVVPDAILMINDWGVDYRGQNRARVDDYYHLVARLLDDGAPIDAVGFQFHLKVGRDTPTVAAIVDNMARYRKLGLSTHITELDIRIPKPVTTEKLREQERLFAIVFRAAVESAVIDDVVMWGFTDRYSWITSGDTFPNDTAGVILDERLQPRPAFYAVQSELARDVRE
jgi:endo-1,4-beta-xylanase